MSEFVVTAGLTRRLVEADSAREARIIYLRDVPRGNLLSVPYEACTVRLATDEDVAEFQPSRSRRAKPGVGQEALVLDDVRKEKKRRRAKKDGGYA